MLKSWYDHPTCCVRHNDQLSDPFVTERGIKRCSVLFSTFFLMVIDLLLKDMSQKRLGLSIHDIYVCSGGHADDICTIATSKSSLMPQALVVRDFTKNT